MLDEKKMLKTKQIEMKWLAQCRKHSLEPWYNGHHLEQRKKSNEINGEIKRIKKNLCNQQEKRTHANCGIEKTINWHLLDYERQVVFATHCMFSE